MKKIISISLVIILAIITLTLKPFLGLADTQEIPKPKAYVVSFQEEAKIKKVDSDWEDVVVGMELEINDEIKTGETGSVVLNFFDNSTARIDANTEIKLEELAIDDDNYAKNNVGINVTIGRVWSRILKLMDKESSYEVGSSATVATVRGTAFDFEVTKDGIVNVDVVEHVVNLATYKLEEVENPENGEINFVKKIINNIDVAEGYSSELDQNKSEEELAQIISQATPTERQSNDWFVNNKEADEDFIQEIKEKKETINKEIAGSLPGTLTYNLKLLSEKANILLANTEEEKEALKLTFANKRLAEAVELAKNGNEELSQESLEKYNESLKEFENLDDNLEAKILNQINLNEELLNNFEATVNNIKENLNLQKEELNKEIIEEKIEQSKELSNDIEELKEKINDPELIDLLEKKSTIPELEPKEIIPTAETLPIIKELIIETEKPTESIEPIAPVESELTKPESTEQEPLKEPEIIQSEEPKIEEDPITTEEIKIIGLSVSATKTNMPANKTNQFKAILEYSDGSIKDVTNECAWNLSGDIGSIDQSGLLQADEDGGKGIVTATYNQDGLSFSASSIEITALTISF